MNVPFPAAMSSSANDRPRHSNSYFDDGVSRSDNGPDAGIIPYLA